MKRIAALLILAFSMNILVVEARESHCHAMEQQTAECSHAEVAASSTDSDSDTKSSSHEAHCSHVANCSFVLNSVSTQIAPSSLSTSQAILEDTLVSVILENPARPPLT